MHYTYLTLCLRWRTQLCAGRCLFIRRWLERLKMLRTLRRWWKGYKRCPLSFTTLRWWVYTQGHVLCKQTHDSVQGVGIICLPVAALLFEKLLQIFSGMICSVDVFSCFRLSIPSSLRKWCGTSCCPNSVAGLWLPVSGWRPCTTSPRNDSLHTQSKTIYKKAITTLQN